MRMLAPCFAVALFASPLGAQALSESRTGPVIDGFGPVYAVPHPDFATPLNREYRVVFEVADAPAALDQVNPRIATLARFLNMHAQAGVPRENLHLALVLHGESGKYALNDAAYRRRYGVGNPNADLLRALHDAGVRVVLCGQTAAHRGLPADELAEPVELALSAMTALVVFQADGYQLISP